MCGKASAYGFSFGNLSIGSGVQLKGFGLRSIGDSDLVFGFRVSYRVIPYPFLIPGYLLFYIADPKHKTRYPQKGVGYDSLGLVVFIFKGFLLAGFRFWGYMICGAS